VDAETLIRQVADKIQAARSVETDRLRGAIQKAIELLQAEMGSGSAARPPRGLDVRPDLSVHVLVNGIARGRRRRARQRPRCTT
jgi:hypothetical protein